MAEFKARLFVLRCALGICGVVESCHREERELAAESLADAGAKTRDAYPRAKINFARGIRRRIFWLQARIAGGVPKL